MWGFFGPAIGLQFGNPFVDVPVLPGIVIFFIGRALSRRSTQGASRPQRDTPTENRVPSRPEPRVKPAPMPERSIQEPLPETEPVEVSEVIFEALESPEPDLTVPGEMPNRKTSAEMVAEARERYGRRP